MVDTATAVKQARATLVTQRRQLQDELRKLDAAISALDSLLPDAPAGPRQRRQRSGVVKPAIIEILKAHAPAPIHADAVVAELREKEIELSAKDPKATAVTAMIRLDQARRDEGATEGVEKLPGNMFRWIWPGITQPEAPISEPASEFEQPSGQSPAAVPESTWQRELARP